MKTECAELGRLKSQLREFCIGKGRGKDPFEAQLKDLGIYLNLDALTDVPSCITEVRKRLGNWPDTAVKAVMQVRTQLLSQEGPRSTEMTVFKYTCMLYCILCLGGFRAGEVDIIIKVARADKPWLLRIAQELYDSGRKVFDKIIAEIKEEDE